MRSLRGMRVSGPVHWTLAVRLCASVFGGCSETSTSPSDAGQDALLDRASMGDGPATGGALGPDPAPRACDGTADAAAQCPSPPSACIDGRFAVNYFDGRCNSGACAWTKSDLDCTGVGVFGGTCAGGALDAGAVELADGAPSILLSGCMVALGSLAPPAVPCDGDASADSGVCPALPSTCGGEMWLLTYRDGQCVGGRCVWKIGALG
ncbi:MAG: hypothetical protein ACREJ3_10710, partial [Polyangiaceae bacterium]